MGDHGSACENQDWYQKGFGELYPIVYAHRTVESAEREAVFAIAQTRMDSKSRVLDLCCGNGRHLCHLAKQTPHATGLDYSDALLALARPLVGDTTCLTRGDMRALPFAACSFDILTNFFTSFGYFTDEGQNRQVLCEVARILCPTGRFFIDYVNADTVCATLVPQSEREYNGYTIKEKRWLDDRARRVNKATEVLRDGHVAGQWVESVRLYGQEEFSRMLQDAGLVPTAMFGDYDGSPVSPERPRMIVTGRKE